MTQSILVLESNLLVDLVLNSGWFQLTIFLALGIGGLAVFGARMARVKTRYAELVQRLEEKDELLAYATEREQKAKVRADILDRAKKELLSRINHNVRTPMNSVIGMANLLSETSLTSEQREYNDAIRNSGEGLLSAINGILEGNVGSKEEIGKMATPIVQAEEREMQTVSPGLSLEFSQKHPMRILVAEDNAINQKLALRVLSKLGYAADISQNGKEVLEVVSNKKYDLILMDVQMPEMDGLEATRMIRLCLATQPVIVAMTANTMQGDREECIQAGMDDYISKPVRFEELVRLLEKWATKAELKQ